MDIKGKIKMLKLNCHTLCPSSSSFRSFGLRGAITLLLQLLASGPRASRVPVVPTTSPNGPRGIFVYTFPDELIQKIKLFFAKNYNLTISVQNKSQKTLLTAFNINRQRKLCCRKKETVFLSCTSTLIRYLCLSNIYFLFLCSNIQ